MESAKQIALEMGRLPVDPAQPSGDRAGPSFAWQPVPVVHRILCSPYAVSHQVTGVHQVRPKARSVLRDGPKK